MVLKVKDLVGIDHEANQSIEDLSDEDLSKIVGGTGDISGYGDIAAGDFENAFSGIQDPTGQCEVRDPSGGCLIF